MAQIQIFWFLINDLQYSNENSKSLSIFNGNPSIFLAFRYLIGAKALKRHGKRNFFRFDYAYPACRQSGYNVLLNGPVCPLTTPIQITFQNFLVDPTPLKSDTISWTIPYLSSSFFIIVSGTRARHIFSAHVLMISMLKTCFIFSTPLPFHMIYNTSVKRPGVVPLLLSYIFSYQHTAFLYMTESLLN